MSNIIRDTRRRAGEHLVSEVNPNMSRKTIVLLGGVVYAAGTVLGQITATKKYAIHDPAATDGTQTAAAVLFAEVDAAAGDKKGVIHRSLCVCLKSLLTWKDGTTDPQKAAAVTALEANHIYMAEESGMA